MTVLLCALHRPPSAAEKPPDAFRRGVEALAEGRYEEAIDQLESLADRGVVHPDASYDRGLAYVLRVRAGAEREGDLGRAAAAFMEALALRPDDEEADHALGLVQAEVARRQARRGKDVLTARPTLGRVLCGLASERSWAASTVASSLVLSLGLVLRRRPRRPWRLAGMLLASIGLVAALVLVPLYLGARYLRLHTSPGVLVVREIYLGDEHIPEGARLELGECRGQLLHVRWGSHEGGIPAAAVRKLQVR
ncbi:MAG: hypothetical protein HY744_04475 [Deltaproteobacteria bacterium]|nr:hypothetical protein [Deltaproteobacteria bacterium]